jgi:hypothetical protein
MRNPSKFRVRLDFQPELEETECDHDRSNVPDEPLAPTKQAAFDGSEL